MKNEIIEKTARSLKKTIYKEVRKYLKTKPNKSVDIDINIYPKQDDDKKSHVKTNVTKVYLDKDEIINTVSTDYFDDGEGVETFEGSENINRYNIKELLMIVEAI